MTVSFTSHKHAIKQFFLTLCLVLCMGFCTACASDSSVSDIPSSDAQNSESLNQETENSNNEATSLATNSDTLTIRYLDVGQGDSALIECGGHWMLIDGGPSSASSKVYSVLRDLGVNQLDYIIATHPDADHIGGLSGALNYAKCNTLYCSTASNDTETFNDLVKYLKSSSGIGISIPALNEEFSLGSARVSIIGPTGIFDSDDKNNNSLIVKIEFGERSFLFMGDAEAESESALLQAHVPVDADVIKLGHHGSSSSSSKQFLKAVSPELAIISVGENSYGHPHDETIDNLDNLSITRLQTDYNGDITISCDGKELNISCSKQSGTAPKDYTDSHSGVSSGGFAAGSAAGSSQSAAANKSNSSNSDASYILNKNSYKIHIPSCSSVEKMSEHNKVYFTGSLDEARSMGYEACKICLG